MSKYKHIGESHTPSTVLIGPDLSQSMFQTTAGGESYYDVQKTCIEGCLQQMAWNCQVGGEMKPRVYVGMMGITSGVPLEIKELQPLPELIAGDMELPAEPVYGGTDHVSFLDKVYDILERKPHFSKSEAKSSFSIVFIISDGGHNASSPSDAIAAAERVKQLFAEDGESPVLIATFLLDSDSLVTPIGKPREFTGICDESEVNGDDAKLLFNMASPIPEELLRRVKDLVPKVRDDARLVFTGDEHMMKFAMNFIAEVSSTQG